MLERILQFLSIKCRHRNTSQPFAAASPDRSSASTSSWTRVGEAQGHYVVCLDCGKKFKYDWASMRIVR